MTLLWLNDDYWDHLESLTCQDLRDSSVQDVLSALVDTLDHTAGDHALLEEDRRQLCTKADSCTPGACEDCQERPLDRFSEQEEWANVSMNAMARVQLNEAGVARLYETRAAFHRGQGVEEPGYDPETCTYTAPLWQVMSVFGPVLHHGSDPLFVDNCIELKVASE